MLASEEATSTVIMFCAVVAAVNVFSEYSTYEISKIVVLSVSVAVGSPKSTVGALHLDLAIYEHASFLVNF
jgi:hypothetical protein